MLLGAFADGMECEYGVLVWQLARLKVRISDLMVAHASECERLQTQVMGLHARRIVTQTKGFWRLGGDELPLDSRASRVAAVVDPEPVAAQENLWQAREVICETGCQGHAHRWLRDGRCQLSSEPRHSLVRAG